MKPTSTPATLFTTGAGLALVTVLGLTACAPDDVAEFSDEEVAEAADVEETPTEEEPTESPEPEEEADDAEMAGDTLVAEVDEPVEFEECTAAEDDETATVTWLEDKLVEQKEFPGTPAETVEIAGENVEIPGAPGVVIPERVAQSGCIIEYEAPGGCLSGFEISRAYIPGYTLPERTLPGVTLPDGTVVEEVVQEAQSVDSETIEGVSAEQICQDEEGAEPGDTVWGVTRWGETRWGTTQWSATTWGETRWSINSNDGARVPTMNVATFSSDTVSIDTVRVDTERLDTYRLEGADHTERSGEEAVYYTTEGDVLFDSSEYELRSDAESELQAIADDVAERDDDFVIAVEGHTDDVPVDPGQDFADNDELSELRAESVAQWLIDNAGIDEDAITAEGLGEDYPRADNDTDEGRQQNRRVVITVTPVDYTSEMDYELENAED